jgi:dephospho-CoA kinase
MIVGLTGGIGSGKTTVANIFAQFDGVIVYNADSEAKKIMESSSIIKSKIIEVFGQKSYENNQLNRPFIASIVFNDTVKLGKLNAIVHPEVKRHFQQFVIQHKNKDYIVYENAILFESESNLKCDIIISVYAPIEIRTERVMLRDKSSREAIEARIKNQWLEEKKLLQSNYMICNIDSKKTHIRVIDIHNILTKKNIKFN